MTQALIINAIVIFVVLESDLGPHRRVTRFRIFRPLVTGLLIVPFFLTGIAGTGVGLALEVGLAVAGALVGLLSATQMRVYRSPRTGGAATRAGVGYALVWIAVGAARVILAYGSEHWFGASLGSWLARHHTDPGALTDSLIFMAVAMVITRVLVMGLRARRHAAPAQAPRSQPQATVID